MVGVASHTDVEVFLTDVLGHVLVGTDTGGLKSLGRKLLELVGDHDDVGGEGEDRGLLGTQVIDADLWVWDTTAEAGLGVRLVLTVTVATSWTTTHGVEFWPKSENLKNLEISTFKAVGLLIFRLLQEKVCVFG